jgi:hypothetical protein
MRRICSSCGKLLGEKPADGYSSDAVTHGLCETCAFHFLAEAGLPLNEYIEGLTAPVVVVAPDGTIGNANVKACNLLGKTPEEIEGFKGGDVFECEYAMLPGGCGKTIHCSGCTIRNTVVDTLQTGTSHIRVPAYLNQYSPDGSRRIRFLISTIKTGGVVFLRIDEVGGHEEHQQYSEDRD